MVKYTAGDSVLAYQSSVNVACAYLIPQLSGCRYFKALFYGFSRRTDAQAVALNAGRLQAIMRLTVQPKPTQQSQRK